MKKIFVILMLILMPITVNVEAEKVSGTEEVKLEKCVDGDTAKFKLKSGDIFTTRFLAVDTPETVHPTKGEEPFGKQASNYNCELLTNAKKIVLEYDIKSEKQDKYNRLLAWVFVDDKLLQALLVRKGLAEVTYIYDKYKYVDLLKDEETLAKVEKIGIWSENIPKKEEVKVEKVKEEKKEKSFIDNIIDMTLGNIYRFISKLIDDIVKAIMGML